MAHDVRKNLEDLLNHIATGRLLDGFDKYYHPDVVMMENAVPDDKRVGKDANRAYEAYFAANATFHDARLDRLVVDGEHSAYEMWMDLSFGDQRMQRTQVAFQTWKDGQIVKEVFYYAA